MKQNIISPELMVVNQYYTFNLNPSKQEDHPQSVQSRWQNMYHHIHSILGIVKKDVAVIEGYLEISRSGRIHLHGWIKPLKILDLYSVIPLILQRSTLEIDTIADFTTWHQYCIKSSTILKSVKTFITNETFTTIPLKEIFESGFKF